MEVSYQPYRRGSLPRSAEIIENAIKAVDEFLYVDVKHKQFNSLQVWRKHPLAHLPFLIFDIPEHASVAEVVYKLRSMDQQGRDIGLESAQLSDQKRRDTKKQKRYQAETFARELGHFIQNNL